MDDVCTYHIEVRGQADARELDAMSPVEMTVVKVDAASTQLTIWADQAGLIGLMRHLHNRGFVFLAMLREE